MKIGEIIYGEGDITYNADAKSIDLEVTNSGDRPIQVGSHFHFYEVNQGLKFDREKAYGKRLDIISGTAVRFEPGVKHTVQLVDIAGTREVYGLNNKIDGKLKER